MDVFLAPASVEHMSTPSEQEEEQVSLAPDWPVVGGCGGVSL